MRDFDYKKYAEYRWDNEILSYLTKIHEYKAKQAVYSMQKPAKIKRLVDVAKIQSIEASNRIEGIVTINTRIRQIVQEKVTPRNRDEKEIAGYRDVLNTVHESYAFIPITGNIIRQFHRDLMRYSETGLGGLYKATQNYLQETGSDGVKFIRFTPVTPIETEPCIDAICENYRDLIESQSVEPLLIVPIFIHDFLCIHPFNDGNGRMSRLLTLLLLYKNGYEVGKYVSIEKHIEKTKDAYYDALEEASVGWHKGEENPIPFIKYMLGVIIACYREFEDRVRIIAPDMFATTGKSSGARAITSNENNGNNKNNKNSNAYDIVKATIETQIGKFTKRDIADICPSISEKSVELSIKKLSDEGYLEKHGTGRNTFYSRTFKSSKSPLHVPKTDL